MTVSIYRSTDPSAPVLTASAGGLINVLDACLVYGYTGHPAAGWTKAFSGSNKAAYKQPVGSNSFYLDVDDTGAASRLRAYETMTAIATGTNPTPNDPQLAGGVYVAKSSAADTIAKPWTLVTNGKIFYLFIDCANTNYADGQLFSFGDFPSYKASDAYNTVIMGNSAAAYSNAAPSGITSALGTTIVGHFIVRSHTQIGTSITSAKITDAPMVGGSMGIAPAMPYPNPIDGGLYLSPLRITEPTAFVIRGIFPGLWCPLHDRPLQQGDTFAGSGTLAGKTFEAFNLYSSAQCFIETSNTW